MGDTLVGDGLLQKSVRRLNLCHVHSGVPTAGRPHPICRSIALILFVPDAHFFHLFIVAKLSIAWPG